MDLRTPTPAPAGLLSFLEACDVNGTLGAPELKDVVVASTNAGVVSSLASFYGLPAPALPPGEDPGRVFLLSAWIDQQLGRGGAENGADGA